MERWLVLGRLVCRRGWSKAVDLISAGVSVWPGGGITAVSRLSEMVAVIVNYFG